MSEIATQAKMMTVNPALRRVIKLKKGTAPETDKIRNQTQYSEYIIRLGKRYTSADRVQQIYDKLKPHLVQGTTFNDFDYLQESLNKLIRKGVIPYAEEGLTGEDKRKTAKMMKSSSHD